MRAAAQELEQHLARESTRGAHLGRDALREAADTLLRRGAPRELLADQRAQVLRDLAGHLGKDGGLARKVQEESGLGNVRGLGDLRDGRGVETLADEETSGGLVDAAPQLALLALPASLARCRPRRRLLGTAPLIMVHAPIVEYALFIMQAPAK